MAVIWSSGPNYCHATSVKLLVFSFYLFIIVGVNIGNCSSDTMASPTTVTSATFIPPTTHAPTIGTPRPATIGPHPPATIAPPPAGNLCGTQQSNSYDLTTLTTPPYWTLNKLGVCFDSYGKPNVGCEFIFAFCKDLPPDIVQRPPGAGASQVSTQLESQRFLLGGRSAVVQKIGGKSPQLLISFENGQITTECGALHVELYLQCKQDAVWAIPISGPGSLPIATTVALDQTNCKYTIQADYSGACSTQSGLSAGTILIILFFCTVAVYLIGGIAYNKFSGARGLELIPNYEVWTKFPSDVMGGVGFVFGMITCQNNTKSEEYDNI